MSPSEHLRPVTTDRGFKHFPPIRSTHGGQVSAYESSAASGPHLWLRIEQPRDLNDPNSEQFDATAHLTLNAASQLRDQLDALIAGHYQLRND